MHDFYAHTLPDEPPSSWQPLEDHLTAVAGKASNFAARFGAQQWGFLAGLWHDLGKYSLAYQEYLKHAQDPDADVAETRGRIDHATAGAQHAVKSLGTVGHILAYAIAGHHSGLLDGIAQGACQEKRLGKQVEDWSSAPNHLLEQRSPNRLTSQQLSCLTLPLFTRMIFSCLVDADFLDTEEFMAPSRASSRPEWPADVLAQMETSLSLHMGSFDSPNSQVDHTRAQVRAQCLAAAPLAPGLFSLTVPTGGGKTLSSLAFALRHALSHGLDRIIYVIPFTSIIEQNAAVFRDVFESLEQELGQPLVLEHHSNLESERSTETARLVSENWDSPLIITTAVQFYESLFANKSSRCRKLHRTTRSVIILDEAQTLPVDYLLPCLEVIRELSTNFGSTVVLCTATQPALGKRDDFPIGLTDVREIIDDPEKLAGCLQRVTLENLGKLDDDALVHRLLAENQVLCIVNTRAHAKRVYQRLGAADENFHLSAMMCPVHRSARLREIRNRLDKDLPCRVVSTQLIEAGVDIDFPVVFRSLAGLDSIAQAAGRCNRNGRLPQPGRVHVFCSDDRGSQRFFKDTAAIAQQVFALSGDPLGLASIEKYFKLYYWDNENRWDSKGILDLFTTQGPRNLQLLFGFARAAAEFNLIETTQRPVIVPWDSKGTQLCELLRESPEVSRGLLRRLQRYTVQIPQLTWDREIGRSLDLVHDRFAIIACPELHYSEEIGLLVGEEQMEGALIA